jgi:hypothetical protein
VSAICVTAAGCASGSGGGGSSSSSALAGFSAKQVLSKAVSDLKSASSFHMAGTVNQGGSIRVDLTYSRGTGCKGTLGIGSKGSISLLVIGGTAWLKPDHAYWTSYAGSSASSVIALIGGKYLKAATSNSNVSGLAQLCNANSLASSFTSPKDIVKGGTSTINGQQALALKDPAKSSAMYVTDTTIPQILRGDQHPVRQQRPDRLHRLRQRGHPHAACQRDHQRGEVRLLMRAGRCGTAHEQRGTAARGPGTILINEMQVRSERAHQAPTAIRREEAPLGPARQD